MYYNFIHSSVNGNFCYFQDLFFCLFFYSYIQLYQIVDFFSFILFATNQNSWICELVIFTSYGKLYFHLKLPLLYSLSPSHLKFHEMFVRPTPPILHVSKSFLPFFFFFSPYCILDSSFRYYLLVHKFSLLDLFLYFQVPGWKRVHHILIDSLIATVIILFRLK